MNLKSLAKSTVIALVAVLMPLGASANTYDAGANGNAIVFSNFNVSPTTYSSTAVFGSMSFACFAVAGPQLPETTIYVKVGPAGGAGSLNVSGGSTANRFEVSWFQASTSTTVTFSPRFVNKMSSPNGFANFGLIINYTTFSLQVAAADTVKVSYAAPGNGDNDIYGTPNGGGDSTATFKPMSFSNLVITPTSIPSRTGVGSCFPSSSGSNSGGGSSPSSNSSAPAGNSGVTPSPKYSGPEFSSFGAATLAGSKLVTSGKKLDAITSMKINGSAVTYKINSASELEIDLPKDLAPGKYDVEINSIHGKLTHLQGITIKADVPTKESSFKAEGAWFNYGSLLELTNIAKKIGFEYNSVKCIVNAADPVVAERLAKRACSYIEANRLRGKAVTYESKSTYKGDGFWVRVVANG